MQPPRLRFGRFVWFITGWCLVLFISGFGLAGEPVTLANVADPGPITADEPFADAFSAEKAARYFMLRKLLVIPMNL